jgi:hypothetical protein
MGLPWFVAINLQVRDACRGYEMAAVNGVRSAWVHRSGVALAILTVTALSAGCSTERIFAPASSASDASASAAAASGSSPSVTSRLADFFSPQPAASASSASLGVNPFETVCPGVDIRLGASTLMIPPGGTDAFALRYQGTINEMARECKVTAGVMRMKVGVQGRILLGPSGGPGALEVPLRYAVVQEGPEPKTIVSKFHKLAVTMTEGRPNAPFVHIDEDISFPMPPGGEIMAYVVYVGFDPIGQQPQRVKKPAARRPG